MKPGKMNSFNREIMILGGAMLERGYHFLDMAIRI